MPKAHLRYCAHPGCSTKVRTRRCPVHSHRLLTRSATDVRYGMQRWRLYSQKRLLTSPFCVDCGGLAEVTDHILSVRTHPHLFWVPTNHASRCQGCNARKAAKDAQLTPTPGPEPERTYVIA